MAHGSKYVFESDRGSPEAEGYEGTRRAENGPLNGVDKFRILILNIKARRQFVRLGVLPGKWSAWRRGKENIS